MLESLFLSLALLATPPAPPVPESKVLRTVWDSSVRVEVRHPHGRTEYGSGTVVHADWDSYAVLTCAHVLADAANPAAKLTVLHMESNSRHPFKVLASCRKRDVAVLSVRATGHKARPSVVATSDEYLPGTKAIRCGFPGARVRQTVRCSILSEKSYIGNEPAAKLVSAVPFAEQGNSGGGLFRASDGALIGVTVMSDHATMSASSLPSVHHILDQAGLKHLVPVKSPNKEK